MPLWAQLVTAIAGLRVAAALVMYLAGFTTVAARTSIPPAAYAGLALAFSLLGVALVVMNRNDVRAAWLGGAFTLLATPLTTALIPASANPRIEWISHVRPDAFLGAFLWWFSLEFPSRPAERARTIGRLVAQVSAVLAAIVAAVNLSIAVWPATGPTLGWRGLLATGQAPGRYYWFTVLVPSAAAFLVMFIRMLAATGDDRARSRIFIRGLVLGILPFFVEVLAEESWPAYKATVHSPAVEPWLGVVLFGALGLVPLLTAYAVVYDRVVDVRVVLRAAIQHAFARYTIVGVTTVPFLALGVYLYQRRADSLGVLLAGPRPVALIGAVTTGIVALRARRRWLAMLDRRFFREVYDAEQLVTQLIRNEVVAGNPQEIAGRLATEIERSLHARADLFVTDEASALLRDPRGARPPISAHATLVSLAMADVRPMDLGLDRGSALERLPATEKAWITDGGYQLIVPLRTHAGAPAGLLALGQKRSELAFSASDRNILSALAAPVALALENERLRQTPEPRTELPARECTGCSRLHAADAAVCQCGGRLIEASAPRLLRGIYQFERRLGAGGMGVVYLARDLSLNREVAIKTLPRVTPEHAARLRREAQAMAAVVDTNLAVIYGIETWKGIPFLVEEYLVGGTLHDELSAGPKAVRDVLDMGVTLAGTLHRLHAAGIVHCDVKPSNIGFTRHLVVKLLDFGLAHLLRSTAPEITSTGTSGSHSSVTSTIVTDRGIVGTPGYMSPEALRGDGPDPSVDLWSLAIVLYESIAGQRPFRGANSDEIGRNIRRGVVPDLRTLRPDCPPHVAGYFQTALSPDRSQRPIDAPAMRSQLLALRAQGG